MKSNDISSVFLRAYLFLLLIGRLFKLQEKWNLSYPNTVRYWICRSLSHTHTPSLSLTLTLSRVRSFSLGFGGNLGLILTGSSLTRALFTYGCTGRSSVALSFGRGWVRWFLSPPAAIFSLVLNYFLKGDEREKVRLTFFPSFGEDGFWRSTKLDAKVDLSLVGRLLKVLSQRLYRLVTLG